MGRWRIPPGTGTTGGRWRAGRLLRPVLLSACLMFPAGPAGAGGTAPDRAGSGAPPELLALQGRASGLGFAAAGRTMSEVFPSGPAAAAGAIAGDTVVAVEGRPLGAAPLALALAGVGREEVRLTLRRVGRLDPLEVTLSNSTYSVNRVPWGRRLPGGVGYVELPALSCLGPDCDAYGSAAHQALRAVDGAGDGPVCGWVVDLRRNRGGNVWPMLAAAGPLAGEGVPLGALVLPGDPPRPWAYAGGAVTYDGAPVATVAAPYVPARLEAPVAVLTGPTTAGAGEQVLLAFKDRPRTRVFGEPSAGAPGADLTRILSGGAHPTLHVAVAAGRSGELFDGPIAPDVYLPVEWTLIESPGDPVLLLAAEWLRAQPCA